jgi:uncharacterized glyoxalase superfamily protein PhnB
MGPVLSHVDVIVEDVSEAVEFYRRAGLDIPEETVWSMGDRAHHVEVVMPGGVRLGIDSVEMTKGYDSGWGNPPGRDGVYLIFSVPTREAVDERYADLTAAGYTGRTPPFDVFWGARYAIVVDPAGNNVGFMSPSDPARQGPPPGL